MLEYLPSFLPPLEADRLVKFLIEKIKWEDQKIKIFGKEISQPRRTAWHGDPEAIYTYSGLTMKPSPWTLELLELKSKIEYVTSRRFNSVLLNLYRNGDDYMGWHSDNEKELGPLPCIASLSLGAVRHFQLKNKEKETQSFNLEHGSLLIMSGDLQDKWKHRIAPTKKSVGPRINLTFRLIGDKKRPQSGPII